MIEKGDQDLREGNAIFIDQPGIASIQNQLRQHIPYPSMGMRTGKPVICLYCLLVVAICHIFHGKLIFSIKRYIWDKYFSLLINFSDNYYSFVLNTCQ